MRTATVTGKSSKHNPLSVLVIREQATAHGRRVWLDRHTPAWNPWNILSSHCLALRSLRARSRTVLSSMNFRRRQRSPWDASPLVVKTACPHDVYCCPNRRLVSSIRCTFFSPTMALIPASSPTRCLGSFSQSPSPSPPPSFTSAFSTRSSPNIQPCSCSHPCPLVSIYSPHPNHYRCIVAHPPSPLEHTAVVRSLTPTHYNYS